MSKNNITDRKFISYCRIILVNKSIDLKRKRSVRVAKEIPIDDLNFRDFNKLFYCENFDQIENEEEYQKIVQKLYEAIQSLPSKNRDIIIMKYWGNFTDQEIADDLKLVRRSVNYNRNRSLKLLKKYLEEDEHD